MKKRNIKKKVGVKSYTTEQDTYITHLADLKDEPTTPINRYRIKKIDFLIALCTRWYRSFKSLLRKDSRP